MGKNRNKYWNYANEQYHEAKKCRDDAQRFPEKAGFFNTQAECALERGRVWERLAMEHPPLQ